MVQEFVEWLPGTAPNWAVALSGAGALFGAVLWAAGSWFNRSLLTLAAVAIGTSVGVRLPRWLGWPIDAWATGVGGALLLGVLAYTLHRLSVALALGLLLAAWAAVATVCLLPNPPAAGPAPIHVAALIASGYSDNPGISNAPDTASTAGTTDFPVADSHQPDVGLRPVALRAWEVVPPKVRQILPFVCGLALAAGLAMTFLWPRFAKVLLPSSAGASLMATLGVVVLAYERRPWLDRLPAQSSLQFALLLALVTVGVVLQWIIASGPAPTVAGPAELSAGGADGAGGKTLPKIGGKPMGTKAKERRG